MTERPAPTSETPFFDFEPTSRPAPAELNNGEGVDLHMRSEHVAPYGTPEEAEQRRKLAQEAMLERNVRPEVKLAPESEWLGRHGEVIINWRQAAKDDFDLAA